MKKMGYLLTTLILLNCPIWAYQTMVDQWHAQWGSPGAVILAVGTEEGRSYYTAPTDNELDRDMLFEIGSLSKSLTGLLFSWMIHHDMVSPDTPAGELWPDEPGIAQPGAEISRITLHELATHTSGLPRLHLPPLRFLRTILHADDPYSGLDRTTLYKDAASAKLGANTFEYSNLGYALLGQLLMERLDGSERFEDVLAGLLGVPLVLAQSDHPVTGLRQGFRENGSTASAWHGDGYFGAVGLLTSPEALMDTLAQLDEPAFAYALQPREAAFDAMHAGYGWFSGTLPDGSTYYWHNGATGGFSSFLAYVPDKNLSIAVTAQTASGADQLGFSVLHDRSAVPEGQSDSLFSWIIGITFICYPLILLIISLTPYRFKDITQVLSSAAGGALMVLFWPVTSPRGLYQSWIETLLMIVMLLAAVILLYRHRHSGCIAQDRRIKQVLRISGTAIEWTAVILVFWSFHLP